MMPNVHDFSLLWQWVLRKQHRWLFHLALLWWCVWWINEILPLHLWSWGLSSFSWSFPSEVNISISLKVSNFFLYCLLLCADTQLAIWWWQPDLSNIWHLLFNDGLYYSHWRIFKPFEQVFKSQDLCLSTTHLKSFWKERSTILDFLHLNKLPNNAIS